MLSIAGEDYQIGKTQSYRNGKKCVLKARNHFVPSAFSLRVYILKYCFFVSRNTLASKKFKTVEKNEKIYSQEIKLRSNQELAMKNNQK